MRRAITAGVTLLASILTAAGLVLSTPGQAHASLDVIVNYRDTTDNTLRGFGAFNSDPTTSGIPGDAFEACDTHADGWGIEVQLDINPTGSVFDIDRSVSTRGHSVPSGGWYCTDWKTGDIKEETMIELRICKIQGGTTICRDSGFGQA